LETIDATRFLSKRFYLSTRLRKAPSALRESAQRPPRTLGELGVIKNFWKKGFRYSFRLVVGLDPRLDEEQPELKAKRLDIC
jgi:hypothetical protein